MAELTPAQVARSDQELAMLDRVLASLIRQWPTFHAEDPRAKRIGNFMHDVRVQSDASGVAGLLGVAVERLAHHEAERRAQTEAIDG